MHIEVLTRAAARTFEELCFIDAQPVTAESHRGATRAAYVRFRGPFTGTLSVRLPEPALREAAENMLGPEALETSGTLDDVVREITNIVCGHVLPLVGGKGAVFDISAPSMIEGTPAVGPTHELAELSVLGQIASISLAVDPLGSDLVTARRKIRVLVVDDSALVQRDYVVRVKDGAPVQFQRPSVDVMFHSVAKAAGVNAVGVLLTGMRQDGAHGLLAMRASGARTVAEAESTAVVFGMPRAAIELGAAVEVLPLDRVASALVQRFRDKSLSARHP